MTPSGTTVPADLGGHESLPGDVSPAASASCDDGALAELLRRNPDSLPAGKILVVNCPGPLTAQHLLSSREPVQLRFLFREAGPYSEVVPLTKGYPGMAVCRLACWDDSARSLEGALVFLPKGRASAEMDVTMASASVKPGGKVALVGKLKEGIRAGKEALARICGPLVSSDSARHAVFASAARTASDIPRSRLGDWNESYSVVVPGGPLRVESFPGVFSHGRLDPGTSLLLEAIRGEPASSVLDFGCGSGTVGATLARSWPDSFVWMSDSNTMAVESAGRTLRANDVNNAQVVLADCWPDEGRKYGLVVSNPPFHSGPRPDFSVLRELWNGAPTRLETRGKLVIVLTGGVPARFMDRGVYQRVRQLVRRGPYRVIEATK